MKKFLISIMTLALVIAAFTIPTFAQDGNVSYLNHADLFVFSPGSEYSPTDLFDNFKNVFPGDDLEQKITVKNNGDEKHYVKIYMRSLGAHKDANLEEGYDPTLGEELEKESEEFLKQLSLTVKNEKTKEIIFDAKADESAQLTDWILLGTFKSGEKADLTVTLHVPITMSNTFQERIGYLDWQFRVDEFPIDDPKTGDHANMTLWIVLACAAVAIVVVAVILLSRKKKQH